ncbi:MAG: ROK family transcriptional regulator [Bacteroidales bacterium]
MINKKRILNLIKERYQISRSEISKETGLTHPTVSRIVDGLVHKDQLVKYMGVGNGNVHHKNGRPPVIVQFKGEDNNIIGIDLGATYIRGCLINLNATCLSEIQIPTEINKGFDSIIEKINQIVEKFKKRKGPNAQIWGVGIGVAGLVNKDTGIIESSPDFGWTNVDLRKELEGKINLPFFYDNSTRLMALGELRFGNKQNMNNFAVINVGYGIAAGLVVEGKLVRGDSGYAGEFGHILVDSTSKVQCDCGMYGCIEALASGHRIANLGIKAFESGESDILKELSGNRSSNIDAEIVGKAAKKGDRASIQIYDEITEYLAKGIATLANLLNPEVVFIGGGISLNGKFFFDLIEKKISKYLLSSKSNLKIKASSFEEQETTMGAVSLIMDKIMNLELHAYNHENIQRQER